MRSTKTEKSYILYDAVFLSDVCYICHTESGHMHAMHIAIAFGQDGMLIASQAMLVKPK